MGQRAAGFSKKKPEVVKATFASVSASDIIRAPAPVVILAVPLDLAALLVPYKRQGRLSLRVEGVPQQARLSTGRNNGDGTWSLASDELEELNFLAPEELCRDRSLTIRIMSFDGSSATTLKVMDFPLSTEAPAPQAEIADAIPAPAPIPEPVQAPAPAPAPVATQVPTPAPAQVSAPATVAADPADLAQLQRLHDELAQMRAILVLRDSELAETRQQADGARTELGRTAADLNERLAVVSEQAARDIEQLRTAWTEEQDSRNREAAAAQLSSRTELDQRLSAASAQTAQEVEKARKTWQAAQDAAVAELKAGAEKRLAEERERLQTESRGALAAAEARWKTEEVARLAAAEAAWRTQSERALAEATKQRQGAETALANAVVPARKNEIELERIRKELAETQAVLHTRDGELAKQRSDGEQSLQRAKLDADAALLNAKAAWKTEEVSRLTNAEAVWKSKSDAALADAMAKRATAELALAEARIRADAVASDGKSEEELERLRKELAGAQTTLGARETELAQLRGETEQARQRGQQDSQSALTDAKAAWKAEEASHLAAAEAAWREKSDAAMADATARFEAAERALAEARSKNAGKARSNDDGYVDRMRGELTALQNVLVGREAELAHARASIEQLRGQYWPEAKSGRVGGWDLGGPEEQVFRRANLRLVRDVVVVVSLVMSLVLFWPRLVTFIPDSWKANIIGLTGGFGLSVEEAPAPVKEAAPAAAAAATAQPQTALVTKSVNMRATASPSAAIVAKLTRGAEVTILEKQGSWTRVGISGVNPLEGWVFSSYLKDAAAPQPIAAPAPTPAPVAPPRPAHASAVKTAPAATAVAEPAAAAQSAPAEAASVPAAPAASAPEPQQ
jgi:Bacterial SH3 domain